MASIFKCVLVANLPSVGAMLWQTERGAFLDVRLLLHFITFFILSHCYTVSEWEVFFIIILRRDNI